MPLYSLTKEKVEELRAKIVDKRSQIKQLEAMSEEELWLKDLAVFE